VEAVERAEKSLRTVTCYHPSCREGRRHKDWFKTRIPGQTQQRPQLIQSADDLHRSTSDSSYNVRLDPIFIQIGGPKAHVTLSMTDTLFQQPASGNCNAPPGCGTAFRVTVGLGPFVEALPYSGKVGATIDFLREGLAATTGVSFNGTAASFTVKSETYLTATVPSGAATGYVTVVTPGGLLKSNKKFRVTQ